jgi:hypothetical protein
LAALVGSLLVGRFFSKADLLLGDAGDAGDDGRRV